MSTRIRFFVIVALCSLFVAAALSMDPVKEKLGLVSFSPMQTASGKIVYKQYEDNTPVPYTMYGLVAGEMLLGRAEPDQEEGENVIPALQIGRPHRRAAGSDALVTR